MSGFLSCEDLQRLHLLKARYFRFLDTKQWSSFRELFADDLTVYSNSPKSAPGDVAFSSADAFVSWVRSALEDTVSVHHGHMPELWQVDEATASGIWAMFDFLQNKKTNRVSRGYGHYHETYRRHGSGWQIAEFRLVRIRVDKS